MALVAFGCGGAHRCRGARVELLPARDLGQGDARLESVIESLQRSKYRGWYAIDQDVRLKSTDEKPLPDIKRALDFLRRLIAA